MKPSHSSSSTHLHLLILILVLVLFVAAAAGDTTPTIFDTICGRNQTQDPEAFDVNFVTTMEMIFQNITESGFGAAVSAARTRCTASDSASATSPPQAAKFATSRAASSSRTASPPRTPAYTSTAASSATPTTTSLRTPPTHEVLPGGERQRGGGVSVYGMAQCWRSLNASGCRECLESARASAVKCLPATDGKALNAGCFVRYSTEPFYLAASSSGGGSSARRTIIVALTSVVAVLAVIGIIIIWKKMRSKDDLIDELDGSGEYIRSISGSHLSFKYEDLRKATDNFNQINKLGQGGYGSVYKGVLSDGREIAVKRLFFTTRPWVDQFFNEVTLVSQVQHKNLVKLLGCSVEGPESLLVYEYLCNTSLDNFLFDSFKKNLLDWERRFEIIVGTAEGLSYLHSASEIRIIHRDIKASNILLDERFKPKIADFGLARNFMEDQSHLSTGLAGTFGYMAPEYIVHGQLTEKADIYSYGVLVLEIITGRKNHNSVASSDEGHSLMSLIWQHFNAKTVIELLDPCLQKRCPEEQALKVFQVGLLCAQASPNLRPPMWKVVELLNSESKELPLPSQPPFINVKGTSSKSNSSESPSVVTSSSKSPFSLNQISVSQLDASSSNVNSQ
uniref:Cysteine-rich receptor-like protein kinase 2 n=1 Tax=Ananas comosus var. bracteatus TaxID=296719 RepID=A0A6V7PCG7_ANACO|nr:unnamed protein product [Ananas comosus var. bracteatus]